ncbi:MAG: 8-oxo-dGTP diphosphatase [Meiothermus sp.]|nr:8-oxo-dGTP diphosphatase [Meiothermus sp.]
MKINTLVFPLDRPNNRVLLGFKKQGFGAGRFVGVGGKLEPGETVAQAAVRELREETGLYAKPQNLWHMVYLEFAFPARPEWHRQVHGFRLEYWDGEPEESDELRPEWFELGAVPYDRMWDDSRLWLPRALRGQKVRMRITYAEDSQTVAEAVELE